MGAVERQRPRVRVRIGELEDHRARVVKPATIFPLRFTQGMPIICDGSTSSLRAQRSSTSSSYRSRASMRRVYARISRKRPSSRA